MRGTFAAACVAFLLTFAVSALTVPDTVIAFPAGYREFTHVKSTLVGAGSPAFATSGGYHHFYANDLAMQGYRTGTFPDGSILVDDGLDAVDQGGVMREGARQRVAVMVKDRSRFSTTGNWGFEVFPGDTRKASLSADGRAACLACHRKAGRDLVYGAFRQ